MFILCTVVKALSVVALFIAWKLYKTLKETLIEAEEVHPEKKHEVENAEKYRQGFENHGAYYGEMTTL